MKTLNPSLLALLGAALLWACGCQVGIDTWEDPDDDAADDDDENYTGEIDLSLSELFIDCNIDDPYTWDEDCTDGGEGTWQFDVILSGWASAVWVEIWGVWPDAEWNAGVYCEGTLQGNPSWDPCEGYFERPGWQLFISAQDYDQANGYTQSWSQTVSYRGPGCVAGNWPPNVNDSLFCCEDYPASVDIFLCGTDAYTGNSVCLQQ